MSDHDWTLTSNTSNLRILDYGEGERSLPILRLVMEADARPHAYIRNGDYTYRRVEMPDQHMTMEEMMAWIVAIWRMT